MQHGRDRHLAAVAQAPAPSLNQRRIGAFSGFRRSVTSGRSGWNVLWVSRAFHGLLGLRDFIMTVAPKVTPK